MQTDMVIQGGRPRARKREGECESECEGEVEGESRAREVSLASDERRADQRTPIGL